MPRDARALVEDGFRVSVEASRKRVFHDAEYAAVGCDMRPAGSWRRAPAGALILGLKELPRGSSALRHRHAYFAHAYDRQRGSRSLLSRFVAGGGVLYDLEQLTDASGARVAAFGYWAGFVGAGLATDLWCHRRLAGAAHFPPAQAFSDRWSAIRRLRDLLSRARRAGAGSGSPSAIVLGAKGRCGQGACELFDALGIEVARWDIEETRGGGPFPQILGHELFVNCVKLRSAISPLLTLQLLRRPERCLEVICDVSCDVNKPHNPLPIYDRPTTLREPARSLLAGPESLARPLELIAIDHLPTLLPRESSEDFSAGLLPHLRALRPMSPVWSCAEAAFRRAIESLPRSRASGSRASRGMEGSR